LATLAGAVIGGAGGSFVGGTVAACRKGWEAGGRYLGASALVVAVVAGISRHPFFSGDLVPALLGLLLLTILLLVSPLLWAVLARWSIRPKP
jgi:hypothetical protein